MIADLQQFIPARFSQDVTQATVAPRRDAVVVDFESLALRVLRRHDALDLVPMLFGESSPTVGRGTTTSQLHGGVRSRVREMYRAGYSVREIAAEVGCSKGNVYHHTQDLR